MALISNRYETQLSAWNIKKKSIHRDKSKKIKNIKKIDYILLKKHYWYHIQEIERKTVNLYKANIPQNTFIHSFDKMWDLRPFKFDIFVLIEIKRAAN